MNFKSFSFFLLLLIASVGIQAQDKFIRLEIGDQAKKGLMSGSYGIVGETDDGFYSLRVTNQGAMIYMVPVGVTGELTLDKYSYGLELQQSLKLGDITMSLLNKAKGKTYEFFTQDENQDVWLFYSDAVGKKNQLYRKKFDPEAFQFGSPMLVVEHAFAHKNLDRRASYYHIQSPDKSRQAIYSFSGEKKATSALAYVEVFDEKFNSLWKFEDEALSFPLKGYDFSGSSLGKNPASGQQACLTNDGVLTLLGGAIKWGGTKAFQPILFAFSSGTSAPQSTLLTDPAAPHIIHTRMILDEAGQLVVFGLYHEHQKKGIQGTHYQRFEPASLERILQKVSLFEAAQYEDFLVSANGKTTKADLRLRKKLQSGKQGYISPFHAMGRLHMHANQSLTFSMESTDVSAAQTRKGNVYRYGDMVFLNISGEGNINWIKNIQKKQEYKSPFPLGHGELFKEDQLFFFFNDLETDVLRGGRINVDGEFRLAPLAKMTRSGSLGGFMPIPGGTVKLQDDSYLCAAIKTLKQRWIRMRIE